MIQSTNFFNFIDIYHGGTMEVNIPKIIKTKNTKDFGFGFYCTTNLAQARKWANRFNTVTNPKKGVVSHYRYFENSNLKILKFTEINKDWLDFIVSCRLGYEHDYDIVEGSMADDQVYDYVQDYQDGIISYKAFVELVKFRYPTHQISFHTNNALKTIQFKNII